jgi:hypothetical protein
MFDGCQQKIYTTCPVRLHPKGRASPFRVPVLVMRLAELKAKPDANHVNTHARARASAR